eukprot:585013-Prymnesium_polylepis.1
MGRGRRNHPFMTTHVHSRHVRSWLAADRKPPAHERPPFMNTFTFTGSRSFVSLGWVGSADVGPAEDT